MSLANPAPLTGGAPWPAITRPGDEFVGDAGSPVDYEVDLGVGGGSGIGDKVGADPREGGAALVVTLVVVLRHNARYLQPNLRNNAPV